MTSIKNDRPTTARTTSTNGPAPTPEPEMSTVDELDGVTDLEALEGQSVEKGTTFESAKNIRSTIVTMTTKKELDPPGPAPLDRTAVSALAERLIGTMAPGEKIVVGGKAEASMELAIGIEVGIEVERRADGKYEVKLEQSGFAGVGGKAGAGGKGGEVKGGVTGASGVSFVVDTIGDAAAIVGEATAAAAMGQLLMPGSGPVAAGAAAMLLNAASISELHIDIGAGIGVELEVAEDLKAVTGGEISAGIVYAPPGQAFLELKGKMEAGGEASLGLSVDKSLLATSGGGEAEITVRVPLGAVASPEALADPATQQALLAKAGAKPSGTTMSYERTLTASTPAARVETTVEKEVEGNRLEALFAKGGWQVHTAALVGPTLGGAIGPLTVEVVMQQSVNVFESTASSPADAAQQVKAHAADIEAKVKKAKQ